MHRLLIGCFFFCSTGFRLMKPPRMIGTFFYFFPFPFRKFLQFIWVDHILSPLLLVYSYSLLYKQWKRIHRENDLLLIPWSDLLSDTLQYNPDIRWISDQKGLSEFNSRITHDPNSGYCFSTCTSIWKLQNKVFFMPTTVLSGGGFPLPVHYVKNI